MMGAEDQGEPGRGFRIWSDMYWVEVVDPETREPVPDGQVGALVVTPLWTNNVTPFVRWLSGDLVTLVPGSDDGDDPYDVFPLVRHAHRTSGFFKVRGVNIGHAEFEDFMFSLPAINDFKCELVCVRGVDAMRVSVELARDAGRDGAVDALVVSIKRRFELTAEVVLLAAGTLAREFEASVKAPRFSDRRT